MTSHAIGGRKLSRKQGPRLALYKNLIVSVLRYERIQTTEAKAKDLRSFADETIGWGVAVQELVSKGDACTAAEKAKIVHAKRMARQTVTTDVAMHRLFSEIGPHFAKRPGGYTRLLKTRVRRGDAAPMALVELVGFAAKE